MCCHDPTHIGAAPEEEEKRGASFVLETSFLLETTLDGYLPWVLPLRLVP
jgi:hypothetical protein